VNGAGDERVANPARAERDLLDRGIVGHHRDDDPRPRQASAIDDAVAPAAARSAVFSRVRL
jgi:hypothetical protein